MAWLGEGQGSSQSQPLNSWLGGMDARGSAAAGVFANSFSRELDSKLRSSDFAGKLALTLTGLFTAAIGIASAGALAAQRRGTGILNLSQASGMSLGQAGGAYSNLQAFGLSPQNVPGIGRDVFMQQMTGGAFGIKGTPGSAEYLRSYSEQYQRNQSNGFMGRTMNRAMEGANDTEGLRFMANLSPELRDKQLNRSASMERAFGMKPEDIRRAGQELTLFNASLGQFIELGLAKVGTVALPRATAGLDNAIGWIDQNGERLAEGIVTGVEKGMDALHSVGKWLYSDLPNIAYSGLEAANSVVGELAQLSVSGIDMIREPWTGLFNTIGRGTTDVTNLIGSSFAGIMNSDFVRQALAFANKAGGPAIKAYGAVRDTGANVTKGISKAFGANEETSDAWGFAGGLATTAAVGKTLWSGAKGLLGFGGAPQGASSGGLMQNAVNFLSKGPTGFSPLQQLMMPRAFGPQVSGRGLMMAARMPVVAAGAALGVAGYEGLRALNIGGFGDKHASTADIASYYFQSKVMGKSDKEIRQARQKAAAPSADDPNGLSVSDGQYSWKPISWQNRTSDSLFGSARAGAQNVANWSDRNAQSLRNRREGIGSVEERRKEYDNFFALERIAKAVEKTADNTGDTNKILPSAMASVAGRALAYQAQDAAANHLRGGGRT